MTHSHELVPGNDELLSDIKALLEDHHESLVAHVEECVSSAVNSSMTKVSSNFNSRPRTFEQDHDLTGSRMSVISEWGRPPRRSSFSEQSTGSRHPFFHSEQENGEDRESDQDHETLAQASRRVNRHASMRVKSKTMAEHDADARKAAEDVHKKEQIEQEQSFSEAEQLSVTQSSAKQVVEHRHFELVCAALILLNSVFIGLELQLNFDNPQAARTPFFVVSQCAFFAVFFLELIFRIFAEGIVKFFLHSNNMMWNYVDVLIIICMMVEVVVQIIITAGIEDDAQGMRGVANVRLLRILRVTRLIRTLRMVRVIRFVRDLRLLVNSIFSTLYALGWSMTLLMMIVYVFAILFTQEAADFLFEQDPGKTVTEGPLANVRQYFGTLGESMFTLFKSISGGISWHEPVEALDEINFLCVCMFTLFVGFVYFAVLNVVTGVFCTSAIESSLRDREHAVHTQIQNKKKWHKSMECLFRSLDSDNSNIINIDEFEKGLQNDKVKAYMASMELEPEDAWTLFKLLDTDSTQSVDVEEFILGCLRLRGPARSLDVAKLIYDTRMMSKRQESFMQYAESQLSRLGHFSEFAADKLKGIRSSPKPGEVKRAIQKTSTVSFEDPAGAANAEAGKQKL